MSTKDSQITIGTSSAPMGEQVTAGLPIRPEVNSQVELTVVPVFRPDDPRSAASPAGAPGAYEVTFVLGVPGTTTYHTSVDFGWWCARAIRCCSFHQARPSCGRTSSTRPTDPCAQGDRQA